MKLVCFKIKMEDGFLVFVYGTLKRDEPNHHYMEKAEFLFKATTSERWPLVISSKYNIPFALYKPGFGKLEILHPVI